MSELVTNKITPATGSSDTVTLGDSGDTFTIPAGVTLAGSGASLTALPAANLTGTTAIANGGTGVTAVGTSGNVLTSTGSAWASTAIPASGITLGTAVASTSGNSIDYTGIPSGTKRITVNVSGLSGAGNSIQIVQLGDAGGFETSGYVGVAVREGGSGNTASSNYSNGFRLLGDGSAATTYSGRLTLELLDAGTFSWTGTMLTGRTDVYGNWGAGAKSLSAELTQIRITTVAGNEAFDAGKVNITYE